MGLQPDFRFVPEFRCEQPAAGDLQRIPVPDVPVSVHSEIAMFYPEASWPQIAIKKQN